MSPSRSLGTRMLFRMIWSTSGSIWPRRSSFTGGRRRPSCWISVALLEKPPGTLPKGLPPVPEATNATLAVFIANKQWTKVESSLKQDPSDELIIEGFPSNDAKNQITAVWAQSCTTKMIQRSLRQQKTTETGE